LKCSVNTIYSDKNIEIAFTFNGPNTACIRQKYFFCMSPRKINEVEKVTDNIAEKNVESTRLKIIYLLVKRSFPAAM